MSLIVFLLILTYTLLLGLFSFNEIAIYIKKKIRDFIYMCFTVDNRVFQIIIDKIVSRKDCIKPCIKYK